MIKAVKKRVRRKLKRPARQMAKDMNVSVTSMIKIIKKYIKLLPYKIRKRQYLTPAQKQKRLDRAIIFLQDLKTGKVEQEIGFLMINSSQLKL